MQITSGELTPDRMWVDLEKFEALLRAKNIETVNVFWGWACELPIDDLWQVIAIPTESLVSYARQGQSTGIFKMGASDLFAEATDGSFKYQLCHNSDIHFEAESKSLAQQVASSWLAQGFNVLSKSQGKWVAYHSENA